MQKKLIKNQKGQGLVEYLIIVAVVAVGSISVIRVVGANINVRFANIADALGGKGGENRKAHEVTDSMVKKKDFSDFFEGSSSK